MVELLANESNDQQKDEGIKAANTRNQIAVWTGLIEARMKLQNVLLSVNKLPHPPPNDFSSKQSESNGVVDLIRSPVVKPSLEKAQKSVNKLLITLLKLREYYHVSTQLSTSIPDEDDANSNDVDEHSDGSKQHESDDSEMEIDCEENKLKVDMSKIKLHSEADQQNWYSRHKKVRSNLINKWYEKTKLGSIPQKQNNSCAGKSKAYGALELSPVTLIDNVLRDKHRLLKRIHTKRANYYIIGNSINEIKLNDPLDEEIFDDEDFYQFLLKELIEENHQSSFNRNKLPKAREKLKRKVDTKASKARKISKKVHPKLINFMAPREPPRSLNVDGNQQNSFATGANASWLATSNNSESIDAKEQARNELLKSLFGGIYNVENYTKSQERKDPVEELARLTKNKLSHK